MMTEKPLVREYAEAGVLIAGGTAGIGFASAMAFAAAGVRGIVILGRNVERGDQARASIAAVNSAVDVRFMGLDATDPAQVEKVVDRAHEALGSIDVAVNSVSSPHTPELLFRTPLADIPEILQLQALPPILMTRAVYPIMQQQGGGSIINVSSDAAKSATPGESVIGGAMAAITMFSKAAALEGKRDGIRVNVVTPSLLTDTLTTERATRGGFSKKLFDKAAQVAQLGVPSADDLASLVVFLGGPGAARLTGQAISVNGGISAA